jgi:hypothetical protein
MVKYLLTLLSGLLRNAIPNLSRGRKDASVIPDLSEST